MMLPSVIAIDGPAGVGKSTIGRLLAERLGYLYFDTGVMYRAVTLEALRRELATDDANALTTLAEALRIDVVPANVDDGRLYTVLVDGRDVTWELRRPEVEAAVSPISAVPGVRLALRDEQRRVAAQGRIVMVGRDIGTVILPDADLKLFVDATVEERARRRYRECLMRGEEVTYEDILASVRDRDRLDRNKPISPLVPAEDAIIVETTGFSVDEVLDQVMTIVGADAGSSNGTPIGR
jgi:cytidylate kinase